MKFGQCIMAAVIVQIQGIKDVSENHKTNGVKLHMHLSSSITFSEWESKTKVLSKSIVYHAICYKKKISYTYRTVLCLPTCSLFIRYTCTCTYSIMEASFVSRTWSVRIQGMDISMGNCNHQMVRSKA